VTLKGRKTMTTRLDLACPVCGAANDAHTEVGGGDAAPSTGDLSICFYCGALSEYLINDMGARLIELDAEQTKEMMSHPGVQKALTAIRARLAQQNG